MRPKSLATAPMPAATKSDKATNVSDEREDAAGGVVELLEATEWRGTGDRGAAIGFVGLGIQPIEDYSGIDRRCEFQIGKETEAFVSGSHAAILTGK